MEQAMETMSHSLPDNEDAQSALKVSIIPASPKCASDFILKTMHSVIKSDISTFKIKYY
jgi:hypothetical protein